MIYLMCAWRSVQIHVIVLLVCCDYYDITPIWLFCWLLQFANYLFSMKGGREFVLASLLANISTFDYLAKSPSTKIQNLLWSCFYNLHQIMKMRGWWQGWWTLDQWVLLVSRHYISMPFCPTNLCRQHVAYSAAFFSSPLGLSQLLNSFSGVYSYYKSEFL